MTDMGCSTSDLDIFNIVKPSVLAKNCAYSDMTQIHVKEDT